MSKHTPGPWEANYGGTVGHIKTVADRRDGGTPTVARFDMAADSIPENEREANARLIAAAPELLAACKLLALYADQECMHVADRLSQGWSPDKSHDYLAEAVIAAQDAIDKATGAPQ